ncbi:SusC/RagA family TonB-linked outer membrane protein [Flavobacteriaceae bacterium]|jgi:TonB-linked SusC/RagA family outer membrane protein|nr:SusC/RagA family TonB-linked outer membrane protein [Flavobacteriaceae bacterium]MDC0386168.1 SusC/RagA family TonB-linked outer membrane protein [Flavobacteriaceae bacterium]
MKVNKNNKLLLVLLLLVSGFTFAQQTISGLVTDEAGVPLPGATVVVNQTNNGTTTDFDGNFSISASDGQSISISFVGYQTLSIVVGDGADYNVSLQPDSLLDEVVVTALGLSREKKSLGYSVSEISGDNINTVKDHNIASSLTGKIAGVNITQSGSIGSGSRITIRGNNSIGGNTQALIVVDGVPINADGIDSGGSVYNSQVTGGGITDINPNDVESISVLKGPNAAALYGSRAGNGVILITTKKGSKSDRLGVTLNTNVTFDDPMFLPEYQNQYGQGSLGAAGTDLVNDWYTGSWGQRLDGSSQLYYNGQQRSYSGQPDNVSDFFRTAMRAITSVSLDKGSESGSVRFSYTNNSTESILPNSDLESHNFNLRGTAQLSDKLSIDSKATYFTQNVNNRASLGGEGVLAYVYTMPRNVDVNDLMDYQMANPSTPAEFGVISYDKRGSTTGNPYWMLMHDRNDERRGRFLGFTKINYEFNDWLSAFVRLGSDITDIKRGSIEKPGHHFYPDGRMSKSQSTSTELNSEFLITAKKDITDKLDLVFNAGGNLSKRTSEGLGISGRNFKIPTRFFISNLNEINPPSERPQAIKKVNSLYGALNLSYDDFLYLDVTARNDWSSTLGEENRSYLYNSASLSALLNRFIDPSQEVFNLIKLRASWAQVGNDTSPYQLYQTFSVPGQGYLGLTTLGSPSVKLNPDLLPETVTSTEFGLELSALENRLTFDISIYDMSTIDLIFNVPVPPATGFSFFKENVGKVQNKGVEINLGGTPIKTSNFSWNTSVFFAKNENTLVELIDDLESITYNTTNSGNASIRATVGGGLGDIYGTVWDTDDSGNNIVNANGLPIASSSLEILGNANPDWLGGWSNSFSFGDLSFSFLIDARIGGQIYSQTSAGLDSSGVSERSLLYRDSGVTLNGTNTETNSANTVPITSQQYWGSYSSIAENYIYDQDNIRLREFALGYRLPGLDEIGLQSATLQLIGRNLFFFSKSAEDIDPEAMLGTALGAQGFTSNALPTLRSVGFNVTLNF